jgi:hypothetical protein
MNATAPQTTSAFAFRDYVDEFSGIGYRGNSYISRPQTGARA